MVLAQYSDGSSCDRDLVLYVWNGETEELETHQTIRDSQCVVDLEVWKVTTGASKVLETNINTLFFLD